LVKYILLTSQIIAPSVPWLRLLHAYTESWHGHCSLSQRTTKATCSWAPRRLPGLHSTQRAVVCLARRDVCYAEVDCFRAVSVILKSELARYVYCDVTSRDTFGARLRRTRLAGAWRQAFLGNNDRPLINAVAVFLLRRALINSSFAHGLAFF